MPKIACALVLMLTPLGAFPGAPQSSGTSEWPQWRGPDRTGISREGGLLESWPSSGPRVLWTISGLGEGYGSLAVQGDRVLVQGSRERESVVHCLGKRDGKTLWTTSIGRKLDHGRGGGPRGTPTVDGDLVYVLTENGDLACLRLRDGSIVWRRNILQDFNGDNPRWLISESPLIDGNRVIVTPGGRSGSLVALDKMTGKTVWTSGELRDPAGYSSCVVGDVGGVRTIATFTARAAVGVRASDGKLMWRYEPVANRTANITTPVLHDGRVFYTSAYGTGCALLRLRSGGGEVKADEVYFSRSMQNHHGGVVLVDGHIYGFSGSILTCVEFATGKVVWRDRSVGKGAVTYADGHLYLLSENNVVGLAEATPSGYREKGRFTIPDQGWPSWSHPVVADGRLYIRDQSMLTCYDVRAR